MDGTLKLLNATILCETFLLCSDSQSPTRTFFLSARSDISEEGVDRALSGLISRELENRKLRSF